MKAMLLALALCLSIPLAAQGKARPKAAVKAPATEPAATAPAPAAPAPAPKPKPRVQINTSYGPIVVELEPALAPRTVANFLRYVEEGHYVGTIFHRVIEGFMVQGGGLLPDLTEKPTHEPVFNEAADAIAGGLANTRGTIAMARTDSPQSATAQFYFNTVDNVILDHKDMSETGYGYCVFGRVVAGMDNVDKIAKVKTVWRKGMQNVPEYAVRIKSVERLPEP